MKRLKDLGIYYKIVVMAVSVVVLLGVLLGLVMWDSLYTLMGQQLEKRGAEIGTHVASLSSNHILVENSYALYDLLYETRTNNEDVRYILVFDHSGRLLAHTFPDGIPKGLIGINTAPINSEYRIMQVDSDEGAIRDILVPIENGTVGFVRIGITEQYTKGLIGKKIRDLTIITFIVCGVAAGLATRVAKIITTPVGELSRVAQEIRGGNLDVKAVVRGTDEIGSLARTFNEMAESLQKFNKERNEFVEILKEKEHLRATLISKLMTAQEDERKRISRELHDETSQALTSLIVSMKLLADRAVDDKQRELILTVKDVATGILHDVRELAVELRPPALDDLGLQAALLKYLSRIEERHNIRVTFKSAGLTEKISGHLAVALYRITQESVSNIIKHSGAANVFVTLEADAGSVAVKIADDGRGITETELSRARQENRLGIYGMRERAELLGGRFEVKSSGRDGGTTIFVSIPILKAGDEGDEKITDRACG